MAYIGVQPADAYTSFAVQHFTTSATTSYTLDNPVANENEIALFINNVRQEPGSSYAYTANGTSLTLSAATSASDTMYCVFIGKAVQTVTPAVGSVTNDMLANSSVTVNGTSIALGASGNISAGITEADQWRFTGTGTVGNSYLTQNQWIRNNTSFSLLGTGMSVSSGVFTFPSTGIYHIEWVISYRGQQAGYASQVGCEIGITTDNSTYNNRAIAYTSHQYDGGGNPYMQVRSTLIFDVTNTTTHKVKFYSMNNNISFTTLLGNSSANQTYATFIRLGDT